MPWQRVFKVSVAIQTMNVAFDPETPEANQKGSILEGVTKDQLNIGLKGQIRYRVSEQNPGGKRNKTKKSEQNE